MMFVVVFQAGKRYTIYNEFGTYKMMVLFEWDCLEWRYCVYLMRHVQEKSNTINFHGDNNCCPCIL